MMRSQRLVHPQQQEFRIFFSPLRRFLIPISFKNDKLGETTLFDAEKAKIHSGIHDSLSVIVIFI